MPTLELTTMVGCPLMCTYCPQDALKKAYGDRTKYLQFSDYVAMLEKVPKYVRIDFSGMAEPWANPHCTQMLRHTLGLGYHVAIYTTLYGMTDHRAVIGLLRDHPRQVEALVLHLPDDRGNMRGFKPDSTIMAAFHAFYAFKREHRLKYFHEMSMGPKHRALHGIATELDNWTGNERAGTLDIAALKGQTVEKVRIGNRPVACGYTPFYDQNVLMPNGDVLLCCMDYGAKHKIGNLMQQSYFEIFQSAEMGRIRAENMRCARGNTICRDCNRAIRFKVGPEHLQFWEQM